MSHQRSPGFSTLALHAGTHPDPAAPDGANPACLSGSCDEVESAASFYGWPSTGTLEGSITSSANAVLEERVAALEGGTAALAVASGHAARLVVFQTLMQPGDEFIASSRLWDGSSQQFKQAFESFGWIVRWADPENPETFAAAVTERTRAIFIASIASPDGFIADIEAIAAVARRAKVPLIVDNTLATPYLARPFDHGADIIVHSATGFLGGQAHATGGVIVDGGSFDWLEGARYPVLSKPCASYGGMILGERFGNFAFAVACRMLGLRDLGLALPQIDAVLTLAGIATLPLRMQRHCDNALAVANHLVRHPAVHWVNYAGLPSDAGHVLQQRYAPQGAGAVFTFGIAGGDEAAVRMVKKLRLFARLVHVGDTRSLVERPVFADDRQGETGERKTPVAGTVRLSIGLEDKEDIIADLDQALAI